MTAADTTYDAGSIEVLEGLEPVRKRPGMYIGDVGSLSGLNHMLWEIVDNGIDEALAGYADNVRVVLKKDNSVIVSDNGRGMPVDIHKKEGKSGAEVIMTVLHAGGKFNQNNYKVAGGLHGVGASVVNALSSWLKLTIYRDGAEYFVEFRNGDAVAPLKRVGKCAKDKTGSTVHFLPNPEIFAVTTFEIDPIVSRLRDMSFLNAGIKLDLIDERQEPASELAFEHKGGIAEMVRYIDRDRTQLTQDPIHLLKVKDGIGVEVAIEWNDQHYSETLLAYTNNIPQADHGTHVAGFKAALTSVLNTYIENEGIKKAKEIESDDFREGMTAVISIRLPDPKFSSQTKEKLVSSEATAAVRSVVAEGLKTWLEEHPADARKIIMKAVTAATAREAVRRAQELSRRESSTSVASLPGKLANCQTNNPAEAELFIVEGDLAGGSAKQGRDRRFQAILPLRGKILNVERAEWDKILASKEIGTLITALGTGIGENFNADKCRYHKIIIMTDADVDGSHIRTLLLTFFFRYMPEIIRRGWLWSALPPLYKLKSRKREQFLDNDAHLEREIIRLGIDDFKVGPFAGDELESRVIDIREAAKAVDFLANRFGGADILDALAGAGIVHLAVQNPDMDFAAIDVASLTTRLNRGKDPKKDGAWHLRVDKDELISTFRFEGVDEVVNLPLRDLTGREGRAIAAAQTSLDQLLTHYPAEAGSYPLGPLSFWREIERRGKKGIQIQRFKGLGEMNAEQLAETTMDPNNRRLIKLGIVDHGQTEQLFDVLMGSAVEPRRVYIEEHGLEANLDL